MISKIDDFEGGRIVVTMPMLCDDDIDDDDVDDSHYHYHYH